MDQVNTQHLAQSSHRLGDRGWDKLQSSTEREVTMRTVFFQVHWLPERTAQGSLGGSCSTATRGTKDPNSQYHTAVMSRCGMCLNHACASHGRTSF